MSSKSITASFAIYDSVPKEVQDALLKDEYDGDWEPEFMSMYMQALFDFDGDRSSIFTQRCMGKNGGSESFETCGWREEYGLELGDKKITGAAKRPLELEVAALKFDIPYSILSNFLFMDFSGAEEGDEPVPYIAFSDMMLMEGSGAL